MLTIFLAFLEGLGLILSPCILPLLPLVLAGSLIGTKKRPLGIILGFILSFALLAYFSRKLVYLTGIDLNWIRTISYFLLFLFSLIMMSSYLTQKFSQLTQKLSNIHCILNTQQEGFWSGLLLGSLISIVWTPCAGPILATVIVQTVLQENTLGSFFVLLAFAAGVGLPMLLIVFYGRQLLNSFSIFKSRADLWRKALGLLLLLSVFFMIFSDADFFDFSKPQTTFKTATVLENGLWQPYKAPEIQGIESWINSKPLTLKELKGKVVLIDFWTYSCINCLRTLPYLKDWYAKYHDKGLVIIGVHSPEFGFEKKLANVSHAVTKNKISYPIALDNRFVTWRNYANQYWPAHYLINKQGRIVYKHFGEGQYEVTENNICFLLGIDELKPFNSLSKDSANYSQTPETYLGYARASLNYSPDLMQNKIAHYHYPEKIPVNAWALEGVWQSNAEYIKSKAAHAKIKIHFQASKVFVVMGNKNAIPLRMKVLFNGKSLGPEILVNHYSIYELFNSKQLTTGILELSVNEAGVELYAFTFG